MNPDSQPLYVDFDDVLCETARALAQIAARRFGWTGTFDDISSFDVAVSFRLDRAKTSAMMDMIHSPEVLLELEPVPGALEAVRALSRNGFSILVVTGRPCRCREASLEWLRERNVPFENLIFADKYERGTEPGVYPVALPLASLASMSFGAAIEDSVETALFLAEKAKVRTILFDRPWNRVLQATSQAGMLTRCHSWHEILDMLAHQRISS